MANNTLFVQSQPFTLAGSGAVLADVTLTLTSFTRIDGTLLTMADFGTKGYGTIAPGSGTQEIPITWTGVVQNANGTATLTGVSTQLTVSPYTETSGLSQSYAGGTTFAVSNTAGFYNALDAKNTDATISAQYTFTNPNYPRMDTATPAAMYAEQLVTKSYADQLAFNGSPNAQTTSKGIVQLSTGTQAQAGVSLGSTGASLVPPNSLFNATSAANVISIPVSRASGKLSATYGSEALSLATLDSNGKVVQLPAQASSTPAVNTIPMTSGSAVLADGWQNISAANAATLTNGSNADSLHIHNYAHLLGATTVAVAIASSAAEATVVSMVVPANALGTNNVITGKVSCSILSQITGANGNLVLALKYGSAVSPTTLVTCTLANATGVTSAPNTGDITFTLYEAGTTSNQSAFVKAMFQQGGSFNGTTPLFQSNYAVGTGTLDSTQSQTLYLTAKFATSNGSNTLTADSSYVTLLK